MVNFWVSMWWVSNYQYVKIFNFGPFWDFVWWVSKFYLGEFLNLGLVSFWVSVFDFSSLFHKAFQNLEKSLESFKSGLCSYLESSEKVPKKFVCFFTSRTVKILVLQTFTYIPPPYFYCQTISSNMKQLKKVGEQKKTHSNTWTFPLFSIFLTFLFRIAG